MFGYQAAGYTTLACYMIYSVGHYYFMNKVCDQFCDGERPYDLKKILMITIPFLMTGLIFLGTYSYPVIRYGIVVVALIIVLIKRKTIIGINKESYENEKSLKLAEGWVI